MENLWLVLFWTGPVGIGIFLVSLGLFIFLLTKADEVSKRAKALAKEMDKKQG